MQPFGYTVAGHLNGSSGVPCPTIATLAHSWFRFLCLHFGLLGLWVHLGPPDLWPHWAPPSLWWLYYPHSSEWTTFHSSLVLGSPGSTSAHRPCSVTQSLPPSGFAWFSSHPDSASAALSPGSTLLIPTQESLGVHSIGIIKESHCMYSSASLWSLHLPAPPWTPPFHWTCIFV